MFGKEFLYVNLYVNPGEGASTKRIQKTRFPHFFRRGDLTLFPTVKLNPHPQKNPGQNPGSLTV